MDIVAALSPLLNVLIQLAAAVLLAVGSWAIAWCTRRLRLDADDRVRDYLANALQHAVDFAETRLTNQLGKAPSLPEHHARMIELAAAYAGDAVPDALKRFGITPATLRTMIEARLPPLDIAPPQPGG